MADADLEFFNSLRGRLQIVLSEPTTSPPGMLNEIASPDAEIVSIRLDTGIFEKGQADEPLLRPLTKAELARIVFPDRWVVLRGEADVPVRHRAPNGRSFSVADLFEAVEETERQTREQTAWLGAGLDVHHVFFEGIRQTKRLPEPQWTIDWGS